MLQNVPIGLSLHFARAKPLIHSAGWQKFFLSKNLGIYHRPASHCCVKRFVLFFPGQRLQCHRTFASLSFVLFFSTFLLLGHRLFFHSDRVLRFIEHLAESVHSLLSFANTDF
ncbi:hypothetical protein BDV38DRAFT_263647 [Aspergillus pseudotamarii]|uniref:Uncharacterized protein n=1 Tax=Aspergillus pseudotamarii TaxID=132259 RepID=A0A5N6SF17_ASPPS|nr:uncharacterized protein BDV38DRAFT_263647 [Aspergillus pseudotamarii]KAE8131704.1 hypothetical protein BDV38DRAFT_263647 [Aspergillus pseudotamarii]